jgi:O-antigen biosynthesis protein
VAFRGGINSLTLHGVTGWVWDTDKPGVPVSLLVLVDGVLVGRVLANRLRDDLVRQHVGDGRHAFDLPFEPPLSPTEDQVVEVQRESDGLHLKNSPMTLRATGAFDEAARALVTRLIGSPTEVRDISERLTFLERETSRLRQTYANVRDDVWTAQERRRRGRADPTTTIGRITPEASAPTRLRALVIDKRPPVADRDGGSRALLSHIEALQRLGHDVTFAPLNLAGPMDALEAAGVRTCATPLYGTIEDVLRTHRNRFDVVYLHRLDAAGRYGGLVRHYQNRARIVFSVADLGFLRLLAQAKVEQLPELEAQAGQLRLAELSACWAADRVITHSLVEAEVLRRNMRPEKVHVVPPAIAVAPVETPFADRLDVAFIGSYGHQPNIDAARFIADALAPQLRTEDPVIHCLLVGSDLPANFEHLKQENLHVVGHVPRLYDVFEQVRLTMAPLAYGAGVKIKVLESLAAGIPCVCTPVAAEGLELPALLKARTIGEPRALPALIRTLHEDEGLNTACAEAGLAYMRRLASPEVVDDLLRRAIA